MMTSNQYFQVGLSHQHISSSILFLADVRVVGVQPEVGQVQGLQQMEVGRVIGGTGHQPS